MSRVARVVLLLAVIGQLVTLGMLGWAGSDPEGPRSGIQRGGDFLSWWAGSVVLVESGPESLYDKRAYEAVQTAVLPQRKPYQRAYPPPIFQVVAPLVPLGYGDASRIFMVGSALMWGVGIALILGALGFSADPRRTTMWIALGSPTLYMVSATGQPSGIWVLLLGIGLHLWTGERRWAAGFVWGLMCAKPPVAAAVALALLLARQRRSFAGFVLGGGALVLVSAAFVGVAPWLDWTELVVSGELGKLNTVLHRHLTARTLFSLPVRRTPLQPAFEQAGMALGLLLAAWCTWRIGRRPDPLEDGGPEKLVCILSVCLFAAPYLIEYDAGLHAGAFAVCALFARGRPPVLALLFVAWLAPVMWPVSKAIHFDLGALAVGAWVLWLVVARPWRPPPRSAQGGHQLAQSVVAAAEDRLTVPHEHGLEAG